MNSTLTLASALYVLIIGLVALLPQAQLAQPAGRTRLLLGALCGAASLVLAADPQTLGQIRPHLHEGARSRLLAELPKNYTNAPREQIERALAPEF